ncbi:MAG: hypothetical protein FWH01_14535 [Oscillospiraceae bacterium]|nr:hypothetical protein [Oscillospiraceae bacterium]
MRIIIRRYGRNRVSKAGKTCNRPKCFISILLLTILKLRPTMLSHAEPFPITKSILKASEHLLTLPGIRFASLRTANTNGIKARFRKYSNHAAYARRASLVDALLSK